MYEYDVCFVDGDGDEDSKDVRADEWRITAHAELHMVQFTVGQRVVFAFPVGRLVYIHETGELSDPEQVSNDRLPTL